MLVGPASLFVDDGDDFGVDQHGVGGLFDLGLLVSQLGDEGAVGRTGGAAEAVQRQQRLTIEHPDLADPPTGAGHQHQDAHDLLVAEPTALDRLPEQVHVAHDLGERGVVDDFLAALAHHPGTTALLPVSPQHGVVGTELQPSGFIENLCGGLAMVGHERVERFEAGDKGVDSLGREGLALVRAGLGDQAAHVAEEIQHERPDPGRVLAQPRRRDRVVAGDPVGEDLQRSPLGAGDRAPGQLPGLQGDFEIPLDGDPQPQRLELLEIDSVIAEWFVGAQRYPRIERRIPHLPPPPRALVVCGPQDFVAAPKR
ncbi:hypothetical protein [Rhodococcus opacus]|uniref:Uncharacterized protein n=1 Tax=Rhodococcus opacus TaxID=37919 RepID=A0A2S8IR83_RHOOP|nr:hypothetical protein C5613_34690 [Rhodococcus opacus]